MKNKKWFFITTLFLFLIATQFSCNLITSFTAEEKDVKGMSFDKNSLELSVGTMDLISLTVDCNSGQNNVSINWEYDPTYISVQSDNYGIVLTGIQTGSTIVKAICGDYSAVCSVRVLEESNETKVENPYIYVSSDYVTVAPGTTEKVSASLYGGTQSDINGYTFTIDKSSVATIYTEGNYCWITGCSEGLARVTARHNKSSYGYSFLVNCTGSSLALPYITTTSNILTINKSTEITKKFTVDLVNSTYPTYADDFTYSVTDENRNSLSNPPIQISYQQGSCTVTALNSGNCYVSVKHKDCSYSLDILVRIVENIDTAYIEPSCGSLLEVDGTNSSTFRLSILDIPETTNVNADDYSWTFSNGAENYIDYQILGGSNSNSGDNIWITGKKSGSIKITVSHPLCSQSRSIVVLVRNIASEASSSNIYITTSQNYVSTTVGAADTTINITLNNLSSGSENDLSWSISNEASDGSTDPVIMYTSGTGQSTSTSVFSRSAAISMTTGKAVITPLKEGKATITISHPKAAYPTKILVVVASSETAKNEPFTLSCKYPFFPLTNGASETLAVELSGNGKTTSDESNIVWNCSSTDFSIVPNGTSAIITANGTGTKDAILKISHPKVTYPIEVRLLSSDSDSTEEPNFKFIYTSTNSYTLYTDGSCQLTVSGYGTSESDSISWSVVSGLNTTIGFTSISNYVGKINALSSGTAEVKATLNSTGESVSFYINIKQAGIVDETLPCYLTTTQNVVTLNKGSTSDISVSPVNITTSDYSKIVWNNNNPELFSISSNNNIATIQALEEGSGSITVTHPISSNTLTINIHIGSEYVYQNTDVAFISTNTDTLLLKTDSIDAMVEAVVAHTESDLTERNNFTFTSSDTTVFTVDYNSSNSYCLITPVKAGQGILKIEHEGCDVKEVLVIIEKSNAELENISYISTTQNVVTVVVGEYTTATAALENSTNYSTSSWNWVSSNTSIADVIVNNGTTAMISGVAPGTTKVRISQSDCIYPIDIIVICLDSDVVKTNPWIKTNTNIVTLKIKESTSITAEMIGGTTTDSSAFYWTVNDSSVALINSADDSCFVKGLKAGLTSISVRNTNYADAYVKTIFVRVEDSVQDECYITLSDKIIKMTPSTTNGATVTATLENGDVLDAQDFIWWADDYKIVNLVSNTDKCNIVPTGLSGTTTVHVKHPKVLNAIDIIVMISEYNTFGFSLDSKQIKVSGLNFITMQVPATSDESWIEYSSDNPNVCAITGSNYICMIAGVSEGYTTLRAELKSSNGTIGTATMAVIVTRVDETLNTISTSSSIINMELGTSQTLTAILSGTDITETDVYNISWVSSNAKIASILQTENGITKGKDVYITANNPGEVLVTLSHPKCLYDLQIWIIIPEKLETSLTLDQTYLEMYKDDGSATITATVINGTTSDEKNITWTAPKVGGQVIVSISKSTGKTCNIVPKSIGSTTLRAQLPNGNYADCIITVQANAEIILETKALHVNPGFSETISYTTTPESVSINWIPTYNVTSSFGSAQEALFTYVVNEAAKTITITGVKLGNGTLQGYFASSSGTATCTLTIYVEYTYELTLNSKSIITTEPRNNAEVEIPFEVYPKTLDVTATVNNPDVLEIKSVSVNQETGIGKVVVKPLKEGINETVNVIATNPNDLINTPIERTQIINSKYDTLHITPVFNFSSGSYSYYSNNHLYLGDGEDFVFYLDVAEENATLNNLQVTYQPIDTASNSNADYKQAAIFNPEMLKDKFHNGVVLDSDNHIFFNGNAATGVLEPEATNSNGKPLYHIGHNYDYVASSDLVLVHGYYTCPTVYNWSISTGQDSSQHIWFDWGWHSEWIYDYSGDLIMTSINGSTTLLHGYTLGYSYSFGNLANYFKSISTKHNSNYYAFERNVFTSNPNYYLNLSVVHDAWGDGSHNVAWYTGEQILYPGYISNTTTKDDSILPRSALGRLTFSYTDINGISVKQSINIIVQVRNCKSSLNGYWEKTTLDNQPCWVLTNTKGLTDVESSTVISDYYFYPTGNNSTLKTQSTLLSLAHNYPTNLFTWSVEDSSILSLAPNKDTCTVTGLKTGTTTINISRNDSSQIYYYNFTVTSGNFYLDSSSISPTGNNFTIEQDTSFSIDIASDKLSLNNINILIDNSTLVSYFVTQKDNNNITVTFTGLSEGTTNFSISHPNSDNTYTFGITVTE